MLLEQPVQQWIVQIPHLLLLFAPVVLSSTTAVVMPQTGMPLYKHQMCPSQLLPVSPSGSQWSFLSVSAWDILFQHEKKGLLRSKSVSPASPVSSSILKHQPAQSHTPLLSSLTWSSESPSLTPTDPSAICPLILFCIVFSHQPSKRIICHLS